MKSLIKEFTLKQHKDILIKHSIEKSIQALDTAEKNLAIDLVTAQNRAYYAVFYIVLALAYLDEFTTGKHHKLMGWFNKKYIYEDKIFDTELNKIYQKLIASRENFDYSVTEYPDVISVKEDLKDAKYFVDTVKNYIIQTNQEC